MKPEEIVVGLDYRLRGPTPDPRDGHIVTALTLPVLNRVWRCIGCKSKWLTNVRDVYDGKEGLVCPCVLHPIPDPDAAPLPAEKEALPA